MSTANEQTRALVWAGGFLIEIARNTALPMPVRKRAVLIARHYPTLSEISLSALLASGEASREEVSAAVREVVRSAADDCAHGPLTDSTRLEWPVEEDTSVPKKPTILALDVEGTLISNAVSQIPRPGLYEFLESAGLIFERVVVFTSLEEQTFRRIAGTLSGEGSVPPWFVDIEFVHWDGPTKNLEFISDADTDEVVLVDDFEGYIHPGQESRWIRIDQFCHPYPADDYALDLLLDTLSSSVSKR